MPRRKAAPQAIFRSPKIETLLVAVPGVGTKPPEEWIDQNGNVWLTGVKAPGIGLYSYEHELSKSATSIWQDLLDHGQKILKALISLIDNQKLQHCPVLLVSHSLGGFIVKECLRLAYERTESHYRSLKRALAGAILMGTPHSIRVEEEKWQNVALLPYVSGLGLKTQSIDNKDIKRLCESSRMFDQAGIECPILSVCEHRQTKLKRSFTSKRVMLVDKDFAKTGSNEEEVLVVDSNHRNLCNESDNKGILLFIATALEDARLNIATDSPLDRSDIDELDDTGYDMVESTTNENSSTDPFTASNTAGNSDLGFELLSVSSIPRVERNLPLLPRYCIPVARNRDFYGRKDILDKIGKYFNAPSAASPESENFAHSFAICGPGGMGKTQIAGEYAHHCKVNKTYDAIFWIHADEPSKVSDGIGQIAIDLGLVSEDSNDALDPVITANLTKAWLSDPVKDALIMSDKPDSRASWLIVFDNVDNLEVLEGVWPMDGPGCILITSRDPLAKQSNILAKTGIDLEPFTIEDSSRMIGQLTGREEDGRGIGERLGGLPLALTQMASIIIRNHMTFEEFTETWDENKEHPEYLGVDEKKLHTEGYDKTLSTVWAIESLRHGRALLDVIAFMDPDNVQEEMLKKYATGALGDYPSSSITYLKARKELLQTSLVSKDASQKNLIVHRLVQDAARSKMQPSHYQSVFSMALELVSLSWPFEKFGWRHNVARWRKCEELFPHVLRLKVLAADIIPSVPSLDVQISITMRGHFLESQSLIETAQITANLVKESYSQAETFQKSPKEVKMLNEIIAETHHNLGCIGTESNQPVFTLKHFTKFNEMMAVEIDEDLQTIDNRLAISWNELGNGYMMNCMWKEGESCFKKSLQIAQRLSSFDPADFSFPYVNLGLAYWLSNRLDDALQTLQEGLHFREAKFGPNDKQSFITGRFLYAIGNVLESQKMMTESLSYHERALSQFLSTIGKNHHRTGDVHVRLAGHHLWLCNFDEAGKHVDEALRIFGDRVIFLPERARALFRKGDILQAAGMATEAVRWQQESLSLYLKISGNGTVTPGSVTDANFESLVAFWSR
ncbi:hypothetical protein BDV96DRAFT_652728 [Lophiotrema nucula]|uniref:DUF7779 domain-containing protein n=1 Tax=Lophiotrema nucula TaxID=690887 RepID=A0A6A5YPZ6_9PLEO|nr:hypothetical protein BDV96DRAFT_652728 [Lophiotrema nucula]